MCISVDFCLWFFRWTYVCERVCVVSYHVCMQICLEFTHLMSRIFLCTRWKPSICIHMYAEKTDVTCRLVNNCYKFITWVQKGQNMKYHSIVFHCQLNWIGLNWIGFSCFDFLNTLKRIWIWRIWRMNFYFVLMKTPFCPMKYEPIHPNGVNAWNERRWCSLKIPSQLSYIAFYFVDKSKNAIPSNGIK